MRARRTVTMAIGPERDVSGALAQLREAIPLGERVALYVALMPPLVTVRRIDLPRMTAGDARRAVSRNVGRYFTDAREPLTIAVRQALGAWIVAGAPAAIVRELYERAEAFGWDVAAIVPAHAAWARAAGEGLVAIASGHETTILDVRGGELRQIRRARASAALPPELASVRVIASSGVEAARLATSHATKAVALDLVPDSVRQRRSAVARRLGWSLVGASAALLVLSAGLTLWGERRELNALRARRADLRPLVQQALVHRDTLVETSDRVNAIAALEQGGERWSAVIARVAEALPADAYLTAFRGEADSVSLEGQASNAAGVFAAMRSTPGLLAVRASAPVRQEGGAGQPVVERFVMGARVSLRSLIGGAP
jgi:Tfp pilus assembly protein PilN